jgi:hypothetical protein
MREESNGQWLTRVTPFKNKIAALAFECLKDEFARADEVIGDLRSQIQGEKNAYAKVHHVFASVIPASKLALSLARIEAVMNNLEGAAFRLEVIEGDVEQRYRPSEIVAEMKAKLDSFYKDHEKDIRTATDKSFDPEAFGS